MKNKDIYRLIYFELKKNKVQNWVLEQEKELHSLQAECTYADSINLRR